MFGEKTPAQDYGLNFNMAMTLMQTNRSEEALKHLLKCLELLKCKDQNWNLDFPNFDTIKQRINVLVNLGLVYQKIGQEK